MENVKLQDILNELWEGKITHLDFDILRNCIVLELEILDTGITSKHRVELMNVSSYFFVNNAGEMRKTFTPYEEGDFLELTSISIIDENVDITTVTEEKWIEQYKSKANIAIEVWSRYLFIEAERILVDGVEHQLTV